MRLLTVADRELRSAARQKATYRTRWITAVVFFGLLVWLLWAFHGFSNRRAVPEIFGVYSVLAFLYCVFVATARTADCISAERREGTLGLLFLTNLNSAEIIGGKLCSTALASVYGLMAIFPMLALPLLLGGVAFGHFTRTVLGLLNGIFFGLAAGFLASVVCKRQFTAIAVGMGLIVMFAGGLMLGAAAASSYGPTRPLAKWLALLSPPYALIAADGTRVLGANWYWRSVGAVAAVALGWLGLATSLLGRTWRDRPRNVNGWRGARIWRRSNGRVSASRTALRRRLLGINPLFWLAARQRVSAPVIMVLAVVVTLVTVYLNAPLFARIMGAGTASPVVGYLFAWFWAGVGIHALVLYYAAMTASQRLAEDRQTGALELILSTPTTERTIGQGLWLAYARKMLFPALLAVLVHAFFIWMVVVLMTVHPPALLPSGTTPGELFWGALLEKPVRGKMLDWQFGFMLRIALLVLVQLMVTWPTLGWVARWLGLRMKHPGFAPMSSLLLVFVPPILLFSLACYLADEFNLDHLPERQFLPLMMWLAVAIGTGHCVALSFWAATCLRRHLRSVAMSRYQPLAHGRWRLPSARAVARFALGVVALVLAIALLGASYYGYQNWRSHRAWRSFQTTLGQSRESLALGPRLPAPVPDSENLARSPAFLSLLNRTNRDSAGLWERLRAFEVPFGGGMGNPILMDWSRHSQAPLAMFARQPRRNTRTNSRADREADAAAILQTLQSRSDTLRELADAATRLPSFQTSTNRDARAVFHPGREPIQLLERAHLLFQVRACALLAVGRSGEAAEDVMAGLRLARLARQVPDVRSVTRVQTLLMRSLQPLWEGLRQEAWTEPQLAAFQRELGGFDLLSDFTNSVGRVVLAHIELWRVIAAGTNTLMALPAADGGYLREPAWRLQPRAWWYQSCIQLYNAGRNTIEQVNTAAQQIRPVNNWSDLDGLPLDAASQELLQQSTWWGTRPGSVAFAQTFVNQATLACALERFRLANGGYPASVDELVPGLLARVPHDAVSGRPIRYQRLDEHSFMLRGVGQNGLDDRQRPVSDDWLWAYSTNAPAAGP